jgi:hypothetical protein
MPARLLRTLILCFIALALFSAGFYCTAPQKEAIVNTEGPTSPWQNVYDTSVHYVGMQTCRGCHPEVYNTFIQTGMGQSFHTADRQKSAADFTPGHALVYDKALDLYYKPFFIGDSLYITEYRTEGRDTVHKRTEHINYIIGSGQHTNSHMYSSNGYLYQAPITFYTQKKQWDFAPGFDHGGNTRFNRIIESECITCHNGYPEFVPQSQNKYTALKNGIDCERCHGPGSLHVANKQNGIIVDTSKGPDYSIVNPRRLPIELQNNVCQRCHLQGVSVLNDGKSFFDFRPGMHLSEMENVFMPRYEGAQDKMIMASHVERMKKSPCYANSGKMSCITCHNPHVSVKFTPRTQYLNACQSCHGGSAWAATTSNNIQPQPKISGQKNCTETSAKRTAKGNDCVTCHMPHNGSIDIPHVAVTDHYIRKRPMAVEEKAKITEFLGLRCFNNDRPDDITIGRAYMEFYERFTKRPGLLDSALLYLNKAQAAEASEKQNRDYIRLYFLLENYGKVIAYAAALQPAQISDAWAAYRIGESYTKMGQPQQALNWYERAIKLMPYALDFQNKYGTCLIALKNLPAAQKVFQFIVAENPKYMLGNSNLGFVYMQQGASTLAYDYLSRALELDPDHEQTLINLAVWHHNNGTNDKARKCLQQLLKRHPGNERAKAMLADLG